jgi:TPR repeat protein
LVTLSQAGKKGNPDALFAVGGLYESGEFAEHGIPKNTHKALKYFRLAAAMGHGDAAARLRAYGVRLSRRGSKQSGSSEVASSTRSYTRQPSASTYSPLSASPERSPGHSEGLPSLSGFSLGRQSSTLSARSRKPNPVSPYKLGRRISRAARTVISKAKRVAARIGQVLMPVLELSQSVGRLAECVACHVRRKDFDRRAVAKQPREYLLYL